MGGDLAADLVERDVETYYELVLAISTQGSLDDENSVRIKISVARTIDSPIMTFNELRKNNDVFFLLSNQRPSLR